MPSSLFGTTNPIVSRAPVQSNPQAGSIPSPQSDPFTIATDALSNAGGDAKKAFYALAEQKGVDPQQVLNQISGMSDPQKLLQNMMLTDPRIGGLVNLFKGIK